LNAAPVDVAEYLRRRLFESDTSVIMTSATLSTKSEVRSQKSEVNRPPVKAAGHGLLTADKAARAGAGLEYFVRRVGAEEAIQLQVGTPFDYERQMKLFVARQMPDPREAGYRDALIHWIEHFVTMTHGKAFVLFT